jgi:hypothetical protein
MTSCTHSHPYAESLAINSDFPSFFSLERKIQHCMERFLDGSWRACLWVCVVLAGCVPIAAHGATFVQVASATPQSPQANVSVTYQSAQAAGDLNVVVVGWNDSTSTVNSVKDSAGNVYQLAVGPTVGTGLEQSIYYAPNIAGGSNTVTVTFSQAAAAPDVRIMEYQGASRLDVAVGKKGSSSSTSSGAATTSGPNELIVAANTVATTFQKAETGYTVRVVTQPDGDLVEDKTAATAGSNNVTATLQSSGPWVMQMAAFAASTAPPAAGMSALTCSSGAMTGAGTDACTVTLNAAAATGGFAVNLASNNSAVTVPASLTVAAGATSASFTAAVATVSAATAVTLTAGAGSVSKTFALQLGASAPTLGVSSASLSFGNESVNSATTQAITLSSTGTVAVTISAATISGAGFTLSGASFPLTLNPAQTATLIAQFDPTAAGAASGSLTLTSNSSSGASTVVSLSGTGVPVPTGLTCTSGSITGAGTDNCTVTLNAAAANGGFAVGLASNNSAVTLPASVTVASGATIAGFAATVTSVSTAATATLTASAGSVSKTFAIQLGASTPTLGVSSASVSFGSSSVNSATTQTITLSSSGNAAVTINSAAISGSGFTVSGATFPLTLNPNQTASLTVQFDPTAAGAMTGTLTLTSNSSTGTSTTVSLSGTGVPVLTGLTCANGSMTGAGTDNCTVTLNAAAASRGFAVSLASSNSAVTVPAAVTVASGASSASFTATVSSVSTAATATLTASSAPVSEAFTLQLGAGTTMLSVNATTIAFGNVNLSSPATQTVTLTSTGTLPVVIASATTLGTGFTVSGATLPLTLSANQTASLSVEFDPTTAGSASGTLTIVSTSTTNPTNVIALNGTGVSTSYEVNLTWSAPDSASDPVAGYNVYRAPSGSTSYQQISTSVVTQTAYTDSSVQTGQTYDYMVESVDASGNDSVPSNMASVAIQ